ncbi:MAG: 16S rRNA (cytidine(1402)-2'-O)-methyltransferase [Alphaproteobacteria bacterium]
MSSRLILFNKVSAPLFMPEIIKKYEEPLAAGLYLTPTPIGCLEDISLRALRVLQQAHLIAAEDTRVTGLLLRHYGIKAKTCRYDDHSHEKQGGYIRSLIREGHAVALVSDAGMPGISDPGWQLLKDCRAEGLAVTVLPGANAVLPGLLLSGLAPMPFVFGGFLPVKSGARKEKILTLAKAEASLVFYESARRILDLLTDAHAALGNRQAALVREISKKFEEVQSGTIAELMAMCQQSDSIIRGEYVVVIDAKPAAGDEQPTDELAIKTRLATLLIDHPPAKAARLVAAEFSLPRQHIYDLALAMKVRHENQA